MYVCKLCLRPHYLEHVSASKCMKVHMKERREKIHILSELYCKGGNLDSVILQFRFGDILKFRFCDILYFEIKPNRMKLKSKMLGTPFN